MFLLSTSTFFNTHPTFMEHQEKEGQKDRF